MISQIDRLNLANQKKAEPGEDSPFIRNAVWHHAVKASTDSIGGDNQQFVAKIIYVALSPLRTGKGVRFGSRRRVASPQT